MNVDWSGFEVCAYADSPLQRIGFEMVVLVIFEQYDIQACIT